MKRYQVIVILLMLFALTGQKKGFSQPEKRSTAPQYFELGESLAGKRQWKEALDAFNACLERNPLFIEAYYARGLVREHFNLLNEALTDYNIYVELRPEHHEALFNRAQLRFKLGQFDQAREDFLKLLTLPAGETSTVFFRQDAFSDQVSQIFTAQGSDKGYLFNSLGLTESELGNLENAIACFDSAIARNPGDPNLLVNRGMAKEKYSQPEAATRDYRRALVLEPQHALANHNLGALHKKLNLPLEASQFLDQAIEENPNMPYAYAERAFTRMEKGQFSEALDDYNHAIRIDSVEEEYFLNRGLVKEKLKDYRGAYADYTNAISLKENFEKAWLNRANLLSRMNKLEEAIEDYSVAIHYHPGYAYAFYNRALAKNRLHRKEEACADLHKALALGMELQARVRQKICEGNSELLK